MAFLILGPHVFGILPVNLQRISYEVKANWPSIARFGGAAARQAVGEGEHTLKLEGLFFPETFGGLAQYRAIQRTALAQMPVMMIGVGASLVADVFGEVVLLSVGDDHDYLGPDGVGRRVRFTVEAAPLGGDGLYGSLFG